MAWSLVQKLFEITEKNWFWIEVGIDRGIKQVEMGCNGDLMGSLNLASGIVFGYRLVSKSLLLCIDGTFSSMIFHRELLNYGGFRQSYISHI